MKALSVRQPWAGLIDAGLKTIEVRTWATGHRGPLLICASAYKFRSSETGEYYPNGVMLAVVDLVDVRPITQKDLKAAILPDDYKLTGRELAWELARPRPVEMTPTKGRLYLFDVPENLIKYAV